MLCTTHKMMFLQKSVDCVWVYESFIYTDTRALRFKLDNSESNDLFCFLGFVLVMVRHTSSKTGVRITEVDRIERTKLLCFLCSIENTVCAADDTNTPEKLGDENLFKQVGHLSFSRLFPLLFDYPAVSLIFILTFYLCSRCRRPELRFAWIGTAKVWMTCVSSHLRHPWGRCWPPIPPTVIPLGCQMPQLTQSWLLMKAFTPFRIVKPNLSMAAGPLTASPWTCWVTNSFWNSYFSHIKAKGHLQVRLDLNVAKTRMSNFSITWWWYWGCRGFK